MLSTEKNYVVEARASKLRVPVLHGISDKVRTLKDLASTEGFDL